MSADSAPSGCAPLVATAVGHGRGVTPPRSQFLFLDVRTHHAASRSLVFFLASFDVSEARPWLLLKLESVWSTFSDNTFQAPLACALVSAAIQ